MAKPTNDINIEEAEISFIFITFIKTFIKPCNSPFLILGIVENVSICFSDFTNFTAKPNIRAIAEADDHEVVREVQVNIGHGYVFF